MSMLPAIFGENLFDEFFSDPFDRFFSGRSPLYGKLDWLGYYLFLGRRRRE